MPDKYENARLGEISKEKMEKRVKQQQLNQTPSVTGPGPKKK